MTPDERLLDYNKRGALSALLAVEEHLAQLPAGERKSWCANKHSMIACDHHLTEAVNHASRIDPGLAAKCRQLRAKAEKVLRPGDLGYLPDLGAVAKLRNDLRRAFDDPTLGAGCQTCRQDGMSGMTPRQSAVAFLGVLAVAWLWLR